ncbi:MAG: peptidoglycan DD-metalloendopeptidase family protein [Rudaea sp.]
MLVAAGCATRRPAPVDDRTLARGQAPSAAPAARAGPGAATEAPPAATYTVKRGDTLHQIALDSGLDYRDLAAWNGIENVNRIVPGQVLRLAPPGQPAAAPAVQEGAGGVTTAPLRTPPPIVEGTPGTVGPGPATPPPPVAAPPASRSATPAVAANGDLKTSPKAIKEPYSAAAVRNLNLVASAAPAPREAPARPDANAASSTASPDRTPPREASSASSSPSTASPSAPSAPEANDAGDAVASGDPDRLDWIWPAKGKIVAGFSETANLKGIDIAGAAGEPVRASAAGRVVYAGNGLRGYGKLIIIKHNATYLSAYAHNREILVKEGQQVTRGQKIAEMGNTDANQVKLHFEIRRHGKPMDPTKYLPPA